MSDPRLDALREYGERDTRNQGKAMFFARRMYAVLVLRDDSGATLSDIAKMFGKTTERIRQIEAKARQIVGIYKRS